MTHPASGAAPSRTDLRRRWTLRSPATHRRLGAALAAALTLVALVSCTSSPKPAAPVAVRSTSATPTPPPPPVLWPLTGVESGSVPSRPALAVKIENSVDARPQTGLNAADMVWEEVVEGGITRYVAVYHSQLPDVIGPVRSIRPMDPPIAAPLHGLFAFAGGQPPFPQAVADAGLQVLTPDNRTAGFYRTTTRRPPHNLYAHPQQLVGLADPAHQAPPPPQFSFAEAPNVPTAVATGTPTGVVRLTLSGVSHPSWTWSQPDGAWLRAEGATPAREADGTQMRATNVVVLRVNLVNTRYKDPAGNPVPETQMVGSGQALVATGGKTLAATWTKNSIGDAVVVTQADGASVTLAPGTTWIELVPNATGAVATG